MHSAVCLGTPHSTGEQVRTLVNVPTVVLVCRYTDARSVGTCIGALFVDQSINGATADVERWLDVYETAQHVVNVCVSRHGFGGKNRGDLGQSQPMHHPLLYEGIVASV